MTHLQHNNDTVWTAVLCYRAARASGTWDRWCAVQMTYCRGAERAAEVMNSPTYGIRTGASPEVITSQLKDIMGSFKVRVLQRLSTETLWTSLQAMSAGWVTVSVSLIAEFCHWYDCRATLWAQPRALRPTRACGWCRAAWVVISRFR